MRLLKLFIFSLFVFAAFFFFPKITQAQDGVAPPCPPECGDINCFFIFNSCALNPNCSGTPCYGAIPLPTHCTNGTRDADEEGRDCGGADCIGCVSVTPTPGGGIGYDCGQAIVPCGYPVCCEAADGVDRNGNNTLEDDYPPGCVMGQVGEDCREPCQLCHTFVLLNNIINFVLGCLVPPIALAMLIIGALIIMFAGGSPGLQSRAKSILKSVIIGLFILYGAWLLINAFLTMIGVQDWTGLRTWFQPAIDCPAGGAPTTGAPGTGTPGTGTPGTGTPGTGTPGTGAPGGCSFATGAGCENGDCPPGSTCNLVSCQCEM